MDEEVGVTIVGSEPEAELVCDVLRKENIPCYYRPTSFAAGVGDGLASKFSPREIVVRSADAERARQLIVD